MSLFRLLIGLLFTLGTSCNYQVDLNEGWYGIIDSENKYFELLIQDKSCYFNKEGQSTFKPCPCLIRNDSLILEDNPFLYSAKIKDRESYYELHAEQSAKMLKIDGNYEIRFSDFIKAIKDKTAQIQSGNFNPALLNETIVLHKKLSAEFLIRQQQMKNIKPNS